MPGLSKVIVLDPDACAGRLVRLGFEREGMPSAADPAQLASLDLLGEDTGLVVVGGVDGAALELVRRTRAVLADRQLDVPIVFAGRGVARAEAAAAGADEVVLAPAFLRDVVTVGRLLRDVPAAQRDHLVGNLIEVTGVFTLVRALAALGRSATLTLVRGLRRGEIRFYHGEVTSAQVGMIHGQAALHQLLLWTDARFDFHHEDIVRRQQIPLSHDELFADAERFLEGVRDSSGRLSPAMVLEQDLPRVQSFGKQIPTEVYGVLRMFDGHRVLADVLEDSAYRVFETLRVTQRAVEIGLLRVVDRPAPRTTWRAVLAIEEWLIGSESREPAVESGPIATREPGPAPDPRTRSSKKRRKKKKRSDTPVAVAVGAPKEIDWGALVPRTVGAEVGPLAGVVPAAQVAGEIVEAPSAGEPRVTRAAEPKVVFDADADAVRASVPAASDPGRVASDLAPDDTKPERLLNRTTLQGVAVASDAVVDVSGAVTARTTVPEITAVELSDATTLRITVPPPPAAVAAPPVVEAVAPAGSAPGEIVDPPSDGVIIQHITTATTAPVKRRRLPTEPTDDDRPDDAMGEITEPRHSATAEPHHSEPSILVADLAAIHGAVSAVAAAQAAAPATPDAASPSREAAVVATRSDAVAFSDAEEAFFRAGHDKDAAIQAPKVESFDDLDEGYRPVGFWDRLRGRHHKRPRTGLKK